MHDPMTVAFEIRYPWRAHATPRNDFERTYRRPLITVWHRDPCVGGDDDSCGWSYPTPPEHLVEHLEHDLGFLCRDDPRELLAQALREGIQMWRLLWLQRASFWFRGKGLTPKQISRWLFEESFPGERDYFPPKCDDLRREAWITARVYCQLIRRWWEHPRWHVWHWELQVHPVQELKRWLFSRCSVCGRGFPWGYSPLSDSWHGTGPRWFRGEDRVRHFDCDDVAPAPDVKEGARS